MQDDCSLRSGFKSAARNGSPLAPPAIFPLGTKPAESPRARTGSRARKILRALARAIRRKLKETGGSWRLLGWHFFFPDKKRPLTYKQKTLGRSSCRRGAFLSQIRDTQSPKCRVFRLLLCLYICIFQLSMCGGGASLSPQTNKRS